MSTAAVLAPFPFPHVDPTQDGISEAQAAFFRDHGLLVIRGLLSGLELSRLQAEMLALVARARAGWDHGDVLYGEHPETGERVPCRVEYVVDKSAAARALLAHPFILRSVERLQGPGFIPTWDAMVFKNAGAGLPVSWHVDAATDCTEADPDGRQATPIFNVDIYLDRADRSNCVWAVPGSNRWSPERRMALCRELNGLGSFHLPHGAVPVPMEPGDVLIHDICVLHGSPATRGPLRRVIYYEYRPCDLERRLGPHTPDYIPLKQRVLRACQRERAAMPYAASERPYPYLETSEAQLEANGTPVCYRIPHQEHWRR
jgi:hypothetical protein